MSIDLLQAHYGFSRVPFGKDLAPHMLHRSAAHLEATARIAWCVQEAALGVITGEVGSGKTVAARTATTALDASRHTIIYHGNPAVGARGLYTTIVTALGGIPRFHKASLIPQTADLLAAEANERGKHVVLIVDEAHLLAADQLEELRLLTNTTMDSHSPFACILVGQPTLRRRIKLGTFAALDQRISLRYAMAPMTAIETADYITQHLTLAGRADPPVLQRRHRTDSPSLTRATPSREQPRPPSPRRRLRHQKSHRRRIIRQSRDHRSHRRIIRRPPRANGAHDLTAPRTQPQPT